MRLLPLLLLAACGAPAGFALDVVDFSPGDNAGFGADLLPDIVLGPPLGAGDRAGSLDVVSLGREGSIVLDLGEFVDRDGVDLIVFENAFTNWPEAGVVGVSEDGVDFVEWPCADDGTGCAGITPVYAHPDNDIDPFDPTQAGGDAFDLADIGLSAARYLRVRDTGGNSYGADTGGFDLDAVAVLHPR